MITDNILTLETRDVASIRLFGLVCLQHWRVIEIELDYYEYEVF